MKEIFKKGRKQFFALVNICVCDKQYSYILKTSISLFLSFFSSYPKASSTFLSAILASIIETRKSSIELCYSKKKSHHDCSTIVHDVQERKRKRKRKRKKSRSLFFFLA
jgi:hypothetical protein